MATVARAGTAGAFVKNPPDDSVEPARSSVHNPGEANVRVFAIGDRVSQPQYGTGTIRLVDERHTVIEFDEHGIRRFSTSMVKLERSSTAEPAKPAKRARKKVAAKT